MPRRRAAPPRGLAAIDSATIGAELRRRPRLTARLQLRRDRFLADAARLDREIARLSGTRNGTAQSEGGASRQTHTLLDVLVRTVGNRSVSLSEATEALRRGGYRDSRYLHTQVSRALSRSGWFRRLVDGRYRAGWPALQGHGSRAMSASYLPLLPLRRFPLSAIQAELDRRTAEVARLRPLRDALLAEVERLADAITRLGSVPHGKGPPRKGKNLVEALAEVLEGKTMTVAQATSAVRRAGYRTASPKFQQIVGRRLAMSGNVLLGALAVLAVVLVSRSREAVADLLRSAFGMGHGERPEERLVGLAVLGLLLVTTVAIVRLLASRSDRG